MKKLLTVVLAMSFAVVAFAQKRGDMSFGASIGLAASSTSVKTTSGSFSTVEKVPGPFEFAIAPEFGYFVADNLKLIGKMSYGVVSNKIEEVDDEWLKYNQHRFLIGAGISYYFRLADRFYYTPQFGMYAAFGSNVLDVDTSTKYSVGTAGFDMVLDFVAFEFKPTSDWGISLSAMSLDFSWLTGKDDSNIKTTYSDVAFNLGINVSVGVRYYF